MSVSTPVHNSYTLPLWHAILNLDDKAKAAGKRHKVLRRTSNRFPPFFRRTIQAFVGLRSQPSLAPVSSISGFGNALDLV
jgi:hypothetical protein